MNLPTPGTSTPRSLRFVVPGFLLTFSKITPFSFASARLLLCLWSAFFVMPSRCAAGIFCCAKIDSFAPRDCRRRSSAICRCLAGFADDFDFSNRCDSRSNRCRSRSCFRLSFSAISSSPAVVGFDRSVPSLLLTSRGGLLDYIHKISLATLRSDHQAIKSHHEGFLACAVELVAIVSVLCCCIVHNFYNRFLIVRLRKS